jgi:hypothetical protein
VLAALKMLRRVLVAVEAIPYFHPLHLLVAVVALKLEVLVFLVALAGALEGMRLPLLAAVLGLLGKEIMVVIAVHHLLIQILLVQVVEALEVWAEILMLLLALAVALVVTQAQAVLLLFPVVLLFTHGAVLVAGGIAVIQALRLLALKVEQKAHQHLQTQAAAEMAHQKLAHGWAEQVALAL